MLFIILSLIICYFVNYFLNKYTFDFRYNVMHFFINLFVCMLTYNDFVDSFNLELITNINTNIINTNSIELTIGLHIFHTLYNAKSLYLNEWVHHIVSNFISGTICIYYTKHKLANVVVFFMCGLPGMFDYLNQILTFLNYMSKDTQKCINTYLNTYIRVPGLLWSSSLIYFLLYKNYYVLDFYYIILGSFLLIATLGNALYYERLVCINYGEKISIKNKSITSL